MCGHWVGAGHCVLLEQGLQAMSLTWERQELLVTSEGDRLANPFVSNSDMPSFCCFELVSSRFGLNQSS